MKKKVRRSPASRRVEETLALPEGILGHCTRMEWTDNRRVLLEGCCEIREYEDDRVEIAVAGGRVRFWGQALALTCLTADSILLTGKMQSVEFLND